MSYFLKYFQTNMEVLLRIKVEKTLRKEEKIHNELFPEIFINTYGSTVQNQS